MSKNNQQWIFEKKRIENGVLKVWAKNTKTWELKYCTGSGIDLQNQVNTVLSKDIDWKSEIDNLLQSWNGNSSLADSLKQQLSEKYWIWKIATELDSVNSDSLFSKSQEQNPSSNIKIASSGRVIIQKEGKSRLKDFIVLHAVQKGDSSLLENPDLQQTISELKKQGLIEGNHNLKLTQQGKAEFEKRYLDAKQNLERNRQKMETLQNNSRKKPLVTPLKRTGRSSISSSSPSVTNNITYNNYSSQVGSEPSDVLLDLMTIWIFSDWLDSRNLAVYAFTGDPTLAIASDWFSHNNNSNVFSTPSFSAYSESIFPSSVYDTSYFPNNNNIWEIDKLNNVTDSYIPSVEPQNETFFSETRNQNLDSVEQPNNFDNTISESIVEDNSPWDSQSDDKSSSDAS